MKIMTSGPITSWQIDGEKVETVRDFIFLGSKITVDGDCSHEIKRYLLLGRKAMTNLGSILKSRDITLLTKVHIVKAMVFSSSLVWMWELNHKEGWDCGAGGDCWESLGFSSKEIKPVLKESSRKSTLNIYWKDWCWSWISSTLVTWCEELTPWKRLWCWERLRAGGEGDNRGWGGWMVSSNQWTWVWATSGRQWRTGRPGILQFMGLLRVGHDLVTEQQWTATKIRSEI